MLGVERRNNWNETLSKAAMARRKRQKRLIQKKLTINQQIKDLTIAEIRSPKYDELVFKRAMIIAQLATI